MSVKAEVYFEGSTYSNDLQDPEWRQITTEIEALDLYLRVQNTRRVEEERLIRLLEGGVL